MDHVDHHRRDRPVDAVASSQLQHRLAAHHSLVVYGRQQFDTSGSVAEEVSEPGNYGFVDADPATGGVGIPGPVCGGPGTSPTLRAT
jgi:hypothetical protein